MVSRNSRDINAYFYTAQHRLHEAAPVPVTGAEGAGRGPRSAKPLSTPRPTDNTRTHSVMIVICMNECVMMLLNALASTSAWFWKSELDIFASGEFHE